MEDELERSAGEKKNIQRLKLLRLSDVREIYSAHVFV